MADPIDFSITKISSILSEPLVAHIQSVAEQKAFTKGEQIEQHGTPSTHISLIRSGTVRLGVDGVDGSQFNMSILGQGNSFGEISVFLREPSRHNAHAETDVVLDRLSLSLINQIMLSHPEFSHAMLTVAYARFRSMLDYIGDAVRQPIEVRAAKLILDICNSSSSNSTIVCRQIDLAHALGVSRVSIGKALKELDNKQLIEVGYGKITIPSQTDLASYIHDKTA
jgi:CRP/FNR family transcriptional regulator